MKRIRALLYRRRSIRRLGNDKGVNLIEAAIITPLLLLLTLGIVDFSAMFYAYLALEHGVSCDAPPYRPVGERHGRAESVRLRCAR